MWTFLKAATRVPSMYTLTMTTCIFHSAIERTEGNRAQSWMTRALAYAVRQFAGSPQTGDSELAGTRTPFKRV